MKKLFKSILSIFKSKCEVHLIEEGWLVQQVRYRRCINCGEFETARSYEYKILTKENCIYYDGEKLER